jgi:hypothetical protein
MNIPIRDAAEIQRAHDMLYAIVVEKLPLGTPPGPELEQAMRDSLDVLCWVLCHEHNSTFAKDLEGIARCLKLQGIEEQQAISE